MAEARAPARRPRAARRPRCSAIVAQRRVVGRRAGASDRLQRVEEELRGVTGRAEEHAAGAEQPGGHRALDRLRRAGVGEPRRERARREAVIGERHEHRVEQAALLRRGLAPRDEQIRELGEREPAHDLARQVAAGHRDLGRGSPRRSTCAPNRGQSSVRSVSIAVIGRRLPARGASKSISAGVRSRGSWCFASRSVAVCGQLGRPARCSAAP